MREQTNDLRDFLWSYWRKEYRVWISGFKKVRKVVVSVRYGGPNTISEDEKKSLKPLATISGSEDTEFPIDIEMGF